MLLGCGQANAWGPEGHAIVAEIAEPRLTPAATAEVTRLLAMDTPPHEHLDEVASWADAYRAHGHAETGPWHYVDIPLDAGAADVFRDCPKSDCIINMLTGFAETLTDKARPDADRLKALKFVVHFVGDIHQPLHCADHGDRGGNEVHLTFLGRRTNFHAVWDGGIIEAELHTHLGAD